MSRLARVLILLSGRDAPWQSALAAQAKSRSSTLIHRIRDRPRPPQRRGNAFDVVQLCGRCGWEDPLWWRLASAAAGTR